MAVKLAYLHRVLEEEIYMEQLEGFVMTQLHEVEVRELKPKYKVEVTKCGFLLPLVELE